MSTMLKSIAVLSLVVGILSGLLFFTKALETSKSSYFENEARLVQNEIYQYKYYSVISLVSGLVSYLIFYSQGEILRLCQMQVKKELEGQGSIHEISSADESNTTM